MVEGRTTYWSGPTWGNCLLSSVARRSESPASILPPPVKTTLLIRTWRSSGSQALRESKMRAGMGFGKLLLAA